MDERKQTKQKRAMVVCVLVGEVIGGGGWGGEGNRCCFHVMVACVLGRLVGVVQVVGVVAPGLRRDVNRCHFDMRGGCVLGRLGRIVGVVRADPPTHPPAHTRS